MDASDGQAILRIGQSDKLSDTLNPVIFGCDFATPTLSRGLVYFLPPKLLVTLTGRGINPDLAIRVIPHNSSEGVAYMTS